jgi:hypothetical protein
MKVCAAGAEQGFIPFSDWKRTALFSFRLDSVAQTGYNQKNKEIRHEQNSHCPGAD